MSSYSFPCVPDHHLSQRELQHVIALSSEQRTGLDRCEWLCHYFLGKPYSGGCLGEGEAASVDQMPQYRTDCFDCVTWVNTVLALLRSIDLASFEKEIIQMSYQDGDVDFLKRCHIMTTQWNRWNTQRGVIRDITEDLAITLGSQASYANALINYSGWLRARSLRDVKLRFAHKEKATSSLQGLHAEANQFHSENSSLPYLPLSILSEVSTDVFPQLSIVEWVRPSWKIAHLIGTDLNVSHVGIAMRLDEGLVFCHASLHHGIQLLPWSDMLASCKRIGVAGINVQGLLLSEE